MILYSNFIHGAWDPAGLGEKACFEGISTFAECVDGVGDTFVYKNEANRTWLKVNREPSRGYAGGSKGTRINEGIIQGTMAGITGTARHISWFVSSNRTIV